jgi:hypothetical protein
MGHFARLQLVGRIAYYAGWISLLLGGLVHFSVGRTLFITMNLTKRNLFEISLMLFVICMASQLRALGLAGNQVPSAEKRAAAA